MKKNAIYSFVLILGIILSYIPFGNVSVEPDLYEVLGMEHTVNTNLILFQQAKLDKQKRIVEKSAKKEVSGNDREENEKTSPEKKNETLTKKETSSKSNIENNKEQGKSVKSANYITSLVPAEYIMIAVEEVHETETQSDENNDTDTSNNNEEKETANGTKKNDLTNTKKTISNYSTSDSQDVTPEKMEQPQNINVPNNENQITVETTTIVPDNNANSNQSNSNITTESEVKIGN